MTELIAKLRTNSTLGASNSFSSFRTPGRVYLWDEKTQKTNQLAQKYDVATYTALATNINTN